MDSSNNKLACKYIHTCIHTYHARTHKAILPAYFKEIFYTYTCIHACAHTRIHIYTTNREFFQNLPYLERVDFSHNKLTGSIPDGLWLYRESVSNPLLTTLMLGGNQLAGTIPHMVHLGYLYTLNVANNRFTGPVPLLPSSLVHLDMSNNGLTGPISAGTMFLPRLSAVYLQGNMLRGTLPGIPSGYIPPVTHIDVSDNMLYGNIPASWGTLIGVLETANLAGNFLAGNVSTQVMDIFKIPGELAQAYSGAGARLDLSNTCLSMDVPATIQYFQALVEGVQSGLRSLDSGSVTDDALLENVDATSGARTRDATDSATGTEPDSPTYPATRAATTGKYNVDTDSGASTLCVTRSPESLHLMLQH